ncbi:hypothetical protein [Streptomyces sp. NPDC051546]|uniref:hypothetical protein n=1 Tax=Streptomyces sp. NPDC051546 TaxID=3365655 RepID=UPI0037B6FE7D
MPLHTDSAPPAHFRARVAGHGGLTLRRCPRSARPPRTRPGTLTAAGTLTGTLTAAGTLTGTLTAAGTPAATTSRTTNTTTENG